ncbi:MAG: EamA family transporter, partial [Clostridiales bacterium]
AKSVAYIILASILFGTVSFWVSLAYAQGLTSFDILFWRFFFALIILAVIIKIKKIPLDVNKKQLALLFLLGAIGYTLMNSTMFVSYQYIPIGLATTIHFAYPIVVTIMVYFLYGDKLNNLGLAALSLATLGIFLLSINDLSADSLLGILLAFLSAIFFSFYVVYTVHPILQDMSIWKILFYVSLTTTILILIVQLMTGTHPLANWDGTGIFFCIILAVACTVIALSLFTIGIQNIGASAACILATLEPITSTLLGTIFLKDQLTPLIIIGCLLIISAVIVITLAQSQNTQENAKKQQARSSHQQ